MKHLLMQISFWRHALSASTNRVVVTIMLQLAILLVVMLYLLNFLTTIIRLIGLSWHSCLPMLQERLALLLQTLRGTRPEKIHGIST